jgi:hypothetical protein
MFDLFILRICIVVTIMDGFPNINFFKYWVIWEGFLNIKVGYFVYSHKGIDIKFYLHRISTILLLIFLKGKY